MGHGADWPGFAVGYVPRAGRSRAKFTLLLPTPPRRAPTSGASKRRPSRVNRPDAVTAFTWLGCWRLERAAGCKNALRTCEGQRGPFPQTAAQLEQAANGVEVVELGIAIRLALTLEGLEYRAPDPPAATGSNARLTR